jgi:hypothetical protein
MCFILLAACVWLMSGPEAQADPHSPLLVNGRGVRRMMLFDVYEITLRTTKSMRRADEVLADTSAQEISLHMLRDAPAEKFIEAIAEGVRENHGETAEAKPLLARFYAALRAADGAAQGSVAKIIWDGLTTSVFLDERLLISVPGTALRDSLLLGWLGDKPVDSELKSKLLGGS